MKKIAIVVAVIMIITAVWAGYSALNKGGQKQSNANPGQTALRGAGNGQRKFDPPGLNGEVASIAGNEVTLKLIEMPKFQANMNRGQGPGGGTRPNGGGWTGGGGPQGGGGQAPQRTVKYTGERKTVIIPVGIPITTMVRTDTGRETKTIEFTKIKKGDILQIWYSDKAREIISRIGIRTITRGGNQ
jgi:hypothetical protein